jgi:hypothetical protein
MVSSEEETVGGDEADRWVPPVIRGREEEGTLSGCLVRWAAGRFGVGPERVPAVQFSYFSCSFSFSFFCFLISILSFANMLQINSNHFQEFSKIQSIKVGQ